MLPEPCGCVIVYMGTRCRPPSIAPINSDGCLCARLHRDYRADMPQSDETVRLLARQLVKASRFQLKPSRLNLAPDDTALARDDGIRSNVMFHARGRSRSPRSTHMETVTYPAPSRADLNAVSLKYSMNSRPRTTRPPNIFTTPEIYPTPIPR